MKRKTVIGIIGWLLTALAVVSLLLSALYKVKTGTDWGYLTYKYQPMTYLGALATFGLLALVLIVGLYYRAKRFLQQRSSAQE